MLNDLRFALRMLRKNPGFTTVVVLTLALGIGGATTIFSVVQCAVLDPFPYANSHRLAVLVYMSMKDGQNAGRAGVSPSEFLDYQQQNRVFDEVIAVSSNVLVLTGTGAPEQLPRSFWVTDNLFRVLGVSPLIGRPLIPEDSKPGAPSVVVLGYKVWQSKFGGDPGIVGHTLVLNGRPTTVVGVMPSLFAPLGGRLYLPAALSRSKATNQPDYFYL